MITLRKFLLLLLSIGFMFWLSPIYESIAEDGETMNKSEGKIPDLNKPIENLLLKAAIANYLKNRSQENQSELVRQLNSGLYLVPIITDEMKTTPIKEGEAVIQKGSLIKFMGVFNANREKFLPAFTDWDEIRAWTKEEVNTLVMPLLDLKSLIVNSKSYKGIIINPAGKSWQLNVDQMSAVIEDSNELK